MCTPCKTYSHSHSREGNQLELLLCMPKASHLIGYSRRSILSQGLNSVHPLVRQDGYQEGDGILHSALRPSITTHRISSIPSFSQHTFAHINIITFSQGPSNLHSYLSKIHIWP